MAGSMQIDHCLLEICQTHRYTKLLVIYRPNSENAWVVETSILPLDHAACSVRIVGRSKLTVSRSGGLAI